MSSKYGFEADEDRHRKEAQDEAQARQHFQRALDVADQINSLIQDILQDMMRNYHPIGQDHFDRISVNKASGEPVWNAEGIVWGTNGRVGPNGWMIAQRFCSVTIWVSLTNEYTIPELVYGAENMYTGTLGAVLSEKTGLRVRLAGRDEYRFRVSSSPL